MTPIASIIEHVQQIERDGYAILGNVFCEEELAQIRKQIASAFASTSDSVRHRNGDVYAVRNVLSIYPAARSLWKKQPLLNLLERTLGKEYGLVRGLFFDKPPMQTWALPWHKDLLIAVQQESVKSDRYSRPRLRIGVPHSEPPLEVLQSMLTLRIHLDDMTAENGPLEVLPGSHHTGKDFRVAGFREEQLTCKSGDVLAIRPLVVHSSGRSHPETDQHRRILHLEFSGLKELPSGIKWWEFYD
ncbi:Phytanoyl-CoA dioxygenase (PhyH) [Rubinisphaera italica]|uniref:Phytanoyl-CoA dioxygenase (PhyH) n=2 Tax=Rubinisphaera italica TaxID=2527969 RepID=A0A5C5XNC1_9PLAN|nr:Phytanoyl-CoA dioxygenase (PhyH) [Rubinisphaera italica]